jgi:UDPglucose--hexose-1-phosphate uridylyltransferase
MPEFRKDPIVNRWVIIAPERAKRPQQSRRDRAKKTLEPCAFCAGNEAMTPPEVLVCPGTSAQTDAPRWAVRVVPNKYPALTNPGTCTIDSSGLYQRKSGLGVHEVIIEAPEHVTHTATLSEQQLANVINAYRERISALRRDRRWRYILVYKNQGTEAGATFEHVHSQLIALPMMPRDAAEEMHGAQAYYDSTGSCIYCDMLRDEINDSTRIVTANDRFVVLSPFASRFPYETWIMPKPHSSSFEQGSKHDTLDLARCLRETLNRLYRALNDPPFNYYIHSNPLADNQTRFYHWHIEILPKLIQVAGFEWGSGSYINPVTPEEAARLLREALL